jgi:MFS family permease
MMVPFIISACLSPFLGGVVDRVGQRANLMLISSIVLTAVHLFFAFGPSVTCPSCSVNGGPVMPCSGLKDEICAASSLPSLSIDIAAYAQPAVGLVCLGIAYSVYAAAIWPAVVYVVKKNQVGTAYGLVTAVQNSGLAIVPLIVGALTKKNPKNDPSYHSGGYLVAEYAFVAFGVAGCLISIILIMHKDGARLNKQDPGDLED